MSDERIKPISRPAMLAIPKSEPDCSVPVIGDENYKYVEKENFSMSLERNGTYETLNIGMLHDYKPSGKYISWDDFSKILDRDFKSYKQLLIDGIDEARRHKIEREKLIKPGDKINDDWVEARIHPNATNGKKTSISMLKKDNERDIPLRVYPENPELVPAIIQAGKDIYADKKISCEEFGSMLAFRDLVESCLKSKKSEKDETLTPAQENKLLLAARKISSDVKEREKQAVKFKKERSQTL